MDFVKSIYSFLSDGQVIVQNANSNNANQKVDHELLKKNCTEIFLKSLAAIKALFNDGKLKYLDEHDNQKKILDRVILVQRFSNEGICIETWITPFFVNIERQCKNPLELNKGEIHLSTRSHGIDLLISDLAQLNENSQNKQDHLNKWYYEINTILTINELEKFV